MDMTNNYSTNIYIYMTKKVQLSLIMPQRHTDILNLGNRSMSG